MHLDAVAVSGPNQYTVRPAALVSTVTPVICAVRNAFPDEAALLAAGAVEVALPGPPSCPSCRTR